MTIFHLSPCQVLLVHAISTRVPSTTDSHLLDPTDVAANCCRGHPVASHHPQGHWHSLSPPSAVIPPLFSVTLHHLPCPFCHHCVTPPPINLPRPQCPRSDWPLDLDIAREIGATRAPSSSTTTVALRHRCACCCSRLGQLLLAPLVGQPPSVSLGVPPTKTARLDIAVHAPLPFRRNPACPPAPDRVGHVLR